MNSGRLPSTDRQSRRIACTLAFVLLGVMCDSVASAPPTLETVFPLGCQAGQESEVHVTGSQMEHARWMFSNIPGFHCEPIAKERFKIRIPDNVASGLYDVWIAGPSGISNVRTFAISHRREVLEAGSTQVDGPMSVPLGTTINGVIETPGDRDLFQFDARAGQRVIVECWAERVDSRLRPVIELVDASGKRLAVPRHHVGTEPLIDFHVPRDGTYLIKLQDLISAGGPEFGYRLDIHTEPRIRAAIPDVIERGKPTQVSFLGWNLGSSSVDSLTDRFEKREQIIEPPITTGYVSVAARFYPAQVSIVDGFGQPSHGSRSPTHFSLSDIPVEIESGINHDASSAQPLVVPGVVCGQLTSVEEVDWYSLEVKRGEVLYFEGFGQRINSPVDLQIGIYEACGSREIASYSDELDETNIAAIPTSHLDPVGRWVVPRDGKYVVAVRDQTSSISPADGRVYRFSVRREEPDFQLLVAPHQSTSPTSLQIQRGGSVALDVVVIRRRGMNAPIQLQVSSMKLGGKLPTLQAAIESSLPTTGIESSQTWIGANEHHATLVISASETADGGLGLLKIQGAADIAGTRRVVPVSVVRTGTPHVWSRIVSGLPFAISDETAPLKITANAHEPVEHHLYGQLAVHHSPGSIVDVSVQMERSLTSSPTPTKLNVIGLPKSIRARAVVVPPGETRAYVSFYIPPTMPLGKFSFAIRADTSMVGPANKNIDVTAFCNALTIDVQPAAFRVEVDPFATRFAKRGETIQIGYTGHRTNGFIGKIHTEIASPGIVTNVPGLRARGETFVGQTDKGSLQIIVNDDAPLGAQNFLRLFSVGVVEDQPTYFGSDYWELEVVE